MGGATIIALTSYLILGSCISRALNEERDTSRESSQRLIQKYRAKQVLEDITGGTEDTLYL